MLKFCSFYIAKLPKPKNISFSEAAGVGLAGLTAWQSLVDSGKIQAGQRVLINGTTGGVGIFAVQIAKAKGCHVVATCSGEKADFVKQLGADETVDYKQGDLVQTLSQTYGTEDKRFDVVFDVSTTRHGKR
jgi:NADPH:quinone reductase-like Zn-dependent oxidoreductase